MLKKLLGLIMLGALVCNIAACGPKPADTPADTTGGTTTEEQQQDDLLGE